MSPDVARAEGRRSAVFMSSMDDSMVDKRRQSLGDTSQFAVRERGSDEDRAAVMYDAARADVE